MAKRYSGQFSPDAPDTDARETVRAEAVPPVEASFRGRAPMRHGAKLNLLFVAPLAGLAASFFQPMAAMTVDLAGTAALFLSAWLTRDGVRAEDAYNERKIARRPAIPRKIFGTAAMGLGVAALVYGGQWNPVTAVLAGGIAAALHLFVFGPDPMRDKGLEGVDRFQTDRVARKIEAAEALLSEIGDAILRARDRQLEARVEAFSATVREMFRTVEDDPRDLTGARKWLGVYLQGARDATVKFADLYSRNRDPGIRLQYTEFLDDLEAGFSDRTRAMLLDDRSDLDIEIDVLRDRLARDIEHIQQRG